MFYAIDEFDVKFSEDRTTLIKAPKTLTGEYIVPKSVTKIQDSAFRNCTSLEKITLPPHLEYLGSHTFSHCDKIISIIFNQESVLQSIGDCCFSNCGQLEAIELPQTIKEIGQYAFYNCQSLKQIKIPDDCICNNSSFDSCLSLCEINIPKSWIEIPSKVFYNCSSLERIKLPNSAKK